MSRTNINTTRTRPESSELLSLTVMRSHRISPGFMRVALGGPEAARFRPMGYDQWFRLFLPVDDGSALSRLPGRMDTLAYLRFLAISRTTRPVMRNYTVRDCGMGPQGQELVVDFVVHGSPEGGTAGPATAWALGCRLGDRAAIIDEGISFPANAVRDRVVVVADESGLPAVAGVLASLPETVAGLALIELAAEVDRQELVCPPGVEVRWLSRDVPHSQPGIRALEALVAEPVVDRDFVGWAVGESSLATGARRHWIAAGVPKENVAFCGYWRADRPRRTS